ncbi:hypothetical protein FisN_7Lh389 [Fistulifera solaris]|uniref:Uncharacterized protein n=1 Tax=Fistulifera solaris TaxID=1519565 RepID=A0A1Z5JBA9_FISSO|nr:hypothetical protein FisN_7Lh389 [Fistulifera solaris]|eukprot:GAX11284.1 hypothetical protein FisN_7Lh389 [Fistulifera solaris]
MEDWKNDLTINSYDTIELLKQSLKQLNYLTQQQSQQEQATCLQGDDEEAKETLESNTRSSLLKLIEEYDQPRSVLLNGRSKTLSRRNSLSSQVSTSSHASNKSVRFGNVSIVTAQELAQLSVTTVDAYERESSARKRQQKKPDKTDVLEEYVKMAQSTRRRPERTHSMSNLSNSSDSKARRRSLFRKKDDSSSVRSKQSAVSLNDSVASSSRSHRNAKQQNRPSSHNGNDNHSVGSSKASRASSPRGSKQQNNEPLNINKSIFVTKMFSKPFQRRKGKHTTTCTQPSSNPTETSNNQDHVDISEVTMDDNITETSSNDDSAAIVMKDSRYQRQRQQRRRTPQKASVPEQPPRRGVRRSNSSGASSVASSRSLVQRAARLLLRRPSANHSDVCSVASSISSSAACVVRDDDTTPLHPSIVIMNEVTEETLDDDDSDDPPSNEDTAKLQYDIDNLKKRIMGLVVEHMEESEKQKQLKLQSKRAVATTAS